MNQMKNNVQNTVNQLLGSEWEKLRNIKTAYSLFTPFKNKRTGQVFYFYIYYAPTLFHLSEETVNYALKKYAPYISQVQFLLVERGFQSNCYLIKSDHHLIDLNQLISLKKQCGQAVQKELIIQTIQFLVSLYKAKKLKQFSQISPKQLGITETGQIILCDYSLYFKKSTELKTLSQNLCNCLIPMLESVSVKSSISTSSLNYTLQERLLTNYNQNFVNLLKTLVLDPINDMQNQGCFDGYSKEIKLQEIETALKMYRLGQINDANTTLNQTFQEQTNQKTSLKDNNAKSYSTNESLKEAFLTKDNTKNSKKNKIIICLTILGLIFFIGVFGFVFLNYFKTPIICQVGSFKKPNSNQCYPCAQGCLRCFSDQNLSCYNCVQTMYLVLNDQKDKTGDCMKSCAGRILHNNFCVRTKQQQNIEEKEYKESNLTV